METVFETVWLRAATHHPLRIRSPPGYRLLLPMGREALRKISYSLLWANKLVQKIKALVAKPGDLD